MTVVWTKAAGVNVEEVQGGEVQVFMVGKHWDLGSG